MADRLDALFLDTSGAPVVAELKRDKATDTVELQALKYAAYCSQLTLDELADEFAATEDISAEDSRARLLDHAPALEDGGLRSVKIRLVAGGFGPAVTSVVLWLREYGIDIGCVEVTARRVAESGQAVISARQLLPLQGRHRRARSHRRLLRAGVPSRDAHATGPRPLTAANEDRERANRIDAATDARSSQRWSELPVQDDKGSAAMGVTRHSPLPLRGRRSSPRRDQDSYRNGRAPAVAAAPAARCSSSR